MKKSAFLKNFMFISGLKIFSTKISAGFSYYLDKSSPRDLGVVETYFTSNYGREIPVYESYRYSIKPCWTQFKGLKTLAELNQRGLLSTSEYNFLNKSMGVRTIQTSIEEIDKISLKAITRSRKLFLTNNDDNDWLPEFLPDYSSVEKMINYYKKQHQLMFKKLRAIGAYSVPEKASILEIGFISGGHSIQAFEKIGLKASGIDNFYGNLSENNSLFSHLKQLMGSKVNFIKGDITNAPMIEPNSFDVIYSISVLEHIQDLQAAFTEMYRILKPGGVIIHNYHPYFSHDGGHALGIGDSPWLHVRLNEIDYLSYLKKLRTHEFSYAANWIKHGLHREISQSKMQKLIALAGFKINLWTAKPSQKKYLKDLSSEIIRDSFENNPGIGMQDLISQSVSFVAQK